MEARRTAVLLGLLWILAPGASAGARQAKVEGVYYLKVRAAPGFDAAERGIIAAGDRVSIIEEVGRWARVRLPNNTTGYVSRKYLVLLDRPDAVEAEVNAPAAPREETTPEPVQQPEARSVVQVAARADAPTDPPAPAERPASADRPDAATDREQPADAPEPPDIPASPVPPAPAQPAPWTAAHVEEVRNALRDLAAGQDRLADLVESRVATSATGRDDGALPDAILPAPPRQVAFWLVVGYVLGWATTMMVGRWRQRRHRHRVRI
jgi:hypothetical protein